ncbi:MAG: DUF2202 domain-containing protein [Thermoanaerobaculia bacterium]|jgi:hypothetical protein
MTLENTTMGPLRLQATLLAILLGANLIGCSGGSSSPTEPSPLDIATTTGSSTLSATTASALGSAIDDEYKARAFYDAVIERFGPVRPFVPIRDAETRHIEALVRLHDVYSLSAPSDPHSGRLEAPDSVQEACHMAVDAEIDNAALYDEILGKVVEADVIVVFEQLRDASLYNHLPAFQRCS